MSTDLAPPTVRQRISRTELRERLEALEQDFPLYVWVTARAARAEIDALEAQIATLAAQVRQ